MKINKEMLLEILRMSKKDLRRKIKSHKDCIPGKFSFLWFKGTGLPCLVAHIDTVYDDEPNWENRDILYNERYIWSPQGIGGDDRCGVYALMELYNELDVNCLFTDLEETGGKGAKEACKIFEEQLENTPYFIEIDRRGFKEFVCYNNDEENIEFIEKVEMFFEWNVGSFSDISTLGEHFNVCSANLSAGFYNEHRKESEYVYLPALKYTMKTIPKLIKELGSKRYELPETYSFGRYEYEEDFCDCWECPFFTPYYCYAREDIPCFGAKGCVYEKKDLTNDLTNLTGKIESDFKPKSLPFVGKLVKKKKLKKRGRG